MEDVDSLAATQKARFRTVFFGFWIVVSCAAHTSRLQKTSLRLPDPLGPLASQTRLAEHGRGVPVGRPDATTPRAPLPAAQPFYTAVLVVYAPCAATPAATAATADAATQTVAALSPVQRAVPDRALRLFCLASRPTLPPGLLSEAERFVGWLLETLAAPTPALRAQMRLLQSLLTRQRHYRLCYKLRAGRLRAADLRVAVAFPTPPAGSEPQAARSSTGTARPNAFAEQRQS